MFVPPRGDVSLGFERARALLPSGPVRLVGHGVTLPDSWPGWVSSSDLTLTELGAYVDQPLPPETVAERRDLRAWLDTIFGHTVDGLPGADVFYGSAATRLFQSVLDAAPFVNGLRRAHPRNRVVVTEPHWAGAAMLAPTSATRPSGSARLKFAARLGLQTIVASAASVAMQLREWQRGRAPRQLLRRVREEARPAPAVWVGLVADWPRFNRHLMDGVVYPTREAGRSIGVLLLSTYLRGSRDEANLARRVGDELWPGLAGLAQELDTLPVGQLVSPLSPRAMLGALGRAHLATARALLSACAAGPSVVLGSCAMDLGSASWELSKLLTIDVQRAMAAAVATNEFATQFGVRGRCVLLSAGSLAPFSAADCALQRAGAVTVEVYHGAGMEGWVGGQESRSTVRALFTAADAETVTSLGQRAVVGGMPRRQSPRPRRQAGPPRVLFLSNYCHRDYQVEGRFAFECFQRELLAVGDELTRRVPGVEVRWRPHPADNQEAVRRGLDLFPSLRRSPNRTLESDFEWADVVVSSMSTTVLEGLFLDLPVFIQIPPEYRAGPNARRYDARRSFFYRSEGIEKLQPVVERIVRAEPIDTTIEAATRVAFFGETGEPQSLLEALKGAGLEL